MLISLVHINILTVPLFFTCLYINHLPICTVHNKCANFAHYQHIDDFISLINQIRFSRKLI